MQWASYGAVQWHAYDIYQHCIGSPQVWCSCSEHASPGSEWGKRLLQRLALQPPTLRPAIHGRPQYAAKQAWRKAVHLRVIMKAWSHIHSSTNHCALHNKSLLLLYSGTFSSGISGIHYLNPINMWYSSITTQMWNDVPVQKNRSVGKCYILLAG